MDRRGGGGGGGASGGGGAWFRLAGNADKRCVGVSIIVVGAGSARLSRCGRRGVVVVILLLTVAVAAHFDLFQLVERIIIVVVVVSVVVAIIIISGGVAIRVNIVSGCAFVELNGGCGVGRTVVGARHRPSRRSRVCQNLRHTHTRTRKYIYTHTHTQNYSSTIANQQNNK